MSGVGEHLGDALSALADGELDGAEAAAARAHLAGCEPCRTELAAVEEARSWLRALPPLDLPPAVVERVRWVGRGQRGPSRLTAAVAAAVAAAASILFVASAAPEPDTVSPKVGQLVEVHATADPNGDPLSRLTPAAVPVSFDE